MSVPYACWFSFVFFQGWDDCLREEKSVKVLHVCVCIFFFHVFKSCFFFLLVFETSCCSSVVLQPARFLFLIIYINRYLVDKGCLGDARLLSPSFDACRPLTLTEPKPESFLKFISASACFHNKIEWPASEAQFHCIEKHRRAYLRALIPNPPQRTLGVLLFCCMVFKR